MQKNILTDIKMANTLKYRGLVNEYANIICMHKEKFKFIICVNKSYL